MACRPTALMTSQLQAFANATAPVKRQGLCDVCKSESISGFHTERGTGGIYRPHDFGKGGYPPHQTAEQCCF